MTVVTAPTRSVTVADVLNQAADYLEEYGWIQGAFGVDGGPRCATGALASALGVVTGEATDSFAWLVVSRYVGSPEGVAEWNDAPGRTKGEVVAALRAAALLEADRNE